MRVGLEYLPSQFSRRFPAQPTGLLPASILQQGFSPSFQYFLNFKIRNILVEAFRVKRPENYMPGTDNL
jgi:hypothetical protein